jgi:hypothetical protein
LVFCIENKDIQENFDILTLNYPEKKALFDEAYSYCIKPEYIKDFYLIR